MNASVERHMLLADIIFGFKVQQEVDQARHMSPLPGHSLIVWKGPGSNLGQDKKIVICDRFNEEYVQVSIQIYQQLYLLIKSIFVANNCE